MNDSILNETADKDQEYAKKELMKETYESTVKK